MHLYGLADSGWGASGVMKIEAKTLIKLTALVVVALETFWVLYLHKEPHAMAVAGSISSLFGMNSAHENLQKYLDNGDGK